MKKTLFWLEFRRALVPFLLVVLASAGGSFLVVWILKRYEIGPSETGLIVDGLLVIIFIVLGFPFGARPFSREFKENQHLFLHSLPLPRASMWGVLVLANFLAGVSALAVLVFLRPSIVLRVISTPPRFQLAVMAYLVLFSAGCCFSLMFRQVVLVYVAGGVLTAGMAFVLGIFSAYSGSYPGELSTVYFPMPAFLDTRFAISAGVLLCSSYLLLSLRTFIGGEFNLVKKQIGRLSLLIVCNVALLLVLSAGLSFGVFAMFDRWQMQFFEADASPSGRYVSILERLEEHPQFSRVSIIEVKSGRLVGRVEQRGIAWAFWSPAVDRLTLVVRDDSPVRRLGYLLPPSDYLVRVSTEGKVLGRTRFGFSRVLTAGMASGQRTLSVVRKGDIGKVLSIDDQTGEVRELSREPLDGWPHSWTLGERSLVDFNNKPLPPALWLIDGEARRLGWGAGEDLGYLACVINGVGYRSPRACANEMRKLYPFTASDGDLRNAKSTGAYFARSALTQDGFWGPVQYVDKSAWVFYLRADLTNLTGALYVLNRQKETWNLLADKIPLTPGDVLGIQNGALLSRNPSTLQTSVLVDSKEGLIVYCVDELNRYRSFLFDANIQKTMELGSVEKQNQGFLGVGMRSIKGMEGVLVFFGWGPRTIAFKYLPQSGVLTKLDLASPHPSSLLFMDDHGNQVFNRGWPSQVLSVTSDQRERQLWPLPVR